MPALIQNADAINRDWLQTILAIDDIEQFTVTESELNTANALLIHVSYATPTPDKPSRLFLKIVRRYSEVSFYTDIAPYTPQIPQPVCHFAGFKDAEGWGNLLLEDISETHRFLSQPLPLSQAMLYRVAEQLAAMHRRWWVADSLLEDTVQDVTALVFPAIERKFASFVDTLGDALSSRRRTWYERLLAAWQPDEWVQRLQKNQQVTLVHGDIHMANVAIPQVPDASVLLMDWSLWHRNIPTYDFSYLFSRCMPEFRARVETPILRHYHTHLALDAYTWDDCWRDYRLTMLFQPLWAVFFHDWADPRDWYLLFETSMTAAEALDCAVLL